MLLKSFPFSSTRQENSAVDRARCCRKSIGPPCVYMYLYLYFSRRTRGFLVCVKERERERKKCCLHDYIIHTYLSFTIDLSQAPEGKVEVCSNAYQYDAHDQRIRYVPFTLLHARLRQRHEIRRDLRVPL